MSKWTFGTLLACLALSVNWADAQPGGATPILVLDLDRAVKECEQQIDIVEGVQAEADADNKKYEPQVKKLQAEAKALMEQDLTQRDKEWEAAVEKALLEEGKLKAIAAFKKIKLQGKLAKAMEKLMIAAKEQAEIVRKNRGAFVVIISKLSPVVFKTDNDIKDELVSRRVLAHDPNIDITKEVIKRMNAAYKKAKKAKKAKGG